MKLLKKTKFISPAKEYDFKKFVNDTSICTSTMIIKRNIIKNINLLTQKFVKIIFSNAKILKVCNAYCLDDFLTKYRIRNNSLQSSSLKNFYWIWKINKRI